MDFESILNQWDKRPKEKKKPAARKKVRKEAPAHSMDDLLDFYPPDEDLNKKHTVYEPTIRQKRRNYRRMKHQDVIDLHGLTARDAESELKYYIEKCKRRGILKVLIIHGKGLHSRGESVLRETVARFLEKSPLVGETGHPSEKDGGLGATWAIIKP